MKRNLSDIVDDEGNIESTTLMEKIGLSLVGLSSLPIIPYIYNGLIANSLESQRVLTSIADHVGNAPHLIMVYYGGKVLDFVFDKERITNTVVGIATTYHVVGEIFNSQFAPSLPKILMGTPDVKDIPLTLVMGVGLCLANKKL